MKLDRLSFPPIATFAVTLGTLIACQNATEPTNNSGPVTTTASYTMGSYSRLPDSVTWKSPKDSGSHRTRCILLKCYDTFAISQPLGQDSIRVQLWTLGIRTTTIYFGEQGSTRTLDPKASSHSDILESLLLSKYDSLSATQKAPFSALGTGASGLVAYYASILLSGDTAFVNKPLPVGMSADSVKKDLVYLGITAGKTSVQLASLNPGLDTGSIRTIAGILVQAKLLKPTDTLLWLHPVRVNANASVSGSLTAGGGSVPVTGSFSWNSGVQVSLSRISVRTHNPGDSSNVPLSYQFNPGKTDTSWSLSGNLTIQALASAQAGWDTLVVTLSADPTHSATVRVPFQVVAKDNTPPVLALLSPPLDTVTVPNGTSSYVVKAVATDSGSGVDSMRIGSKTIRTTASIADTFSDTIQLVVGANVVSVQAWDHAGNTSNANATITRAPAPANTKPPTIIHVSPLQDTVTVPWGTKFGTLSWTITGDTALVTVNLGRKPLPGNAGLYGTTLPLDVGVNTFALAAVDAYGLAAFDTVRITRQSDTSHPLFGRGPGANDTVLLKSQTSYTPVWTVTDNALDSVTINGAVAIAGNANSYSAPVPVSGDSLWITLVAKDSSRNTTRDSIKVRRIGAPTISPAGGILSGTQTVTPTISSNLPGATLSYSTSTNPSSWTIGASPFVSSNQILYAKATVGNVTSLLDSVLFLYIPAPTLSGVTATQATVTITPAGSVGIEDSLSTGSSWISYSGSFSVIGNIKVFARSHMGGSVTAPQEVDFAIPPVFIPPSKDTGVDSVVVAISSPGADSVQVTLNRQQWIPLNPASPVFAMHSSGTLYGRSWVGNTVSAVDSVDIQMYPSAPRFSTSSGTYPFAQTVRLASIPAGASIYYTTDGSTPTINSALYKDSILVGTSKNIKAIAIKSGFQNSAVSSAAFAIADTNTYGIPWNSSITYGALTDVRDSQIYRTVKIGTQTWMAQNLNYRGKPGSTDTLGACPTAIADSCKKYGRQYTWAITMAGGGASNSVPSGVAGICPIGTHVPSDTEWSVLISIIDSAGIKLKSVRGWNSDKGSDSYGFRAIPAGFGNSEVGSYAIWWTSTEYAVGGAWSREATLGNGQEWIARNIFTETITESIRCVQDPP